MKVLIVDDEPLARAGLRQLLLREPDIEIVGECSSAEEAYQLIESLSPDVIFLDVQMPGTDGLKFAKSIHSDSAPLIVFVTAFAEHAATAFELEALDYVLKPMEAGRVASACARARVALNAAPDVSADKTEGLRTVAHINRPIKGRIVIHTEKRALILKTAQIDWIEAAGNYVKIHTATDTYLVREALSNLERLFDDEAFARIHRSTIVNLDSVRELKPWFSGEMIVVMKDDTELRLSRSYRKIFEARLPFLS